MGYPGEPMYERKAKVMEKAAGFLEEGKVYEEAVRVYDELGHELERALLFERAAGIWSKKSSVLRKIVSEERFAVAFYRIGYFGKGVASSVRNQEFVMRGRPLEQMSDVQNRLRTRYPAATFLPNKAKIEEYFEADGFFIQIAKVEPVVEKESLPTSPYGIAISKNQADFFKTAYVSCFKSSRPLKKEGVVKNKQNEFATLYTLETTVTTRVLPSVLTRAPVLKREDREITPILGSLTMVGDKNAELADMATKYGAPGNSDNINPLLMAANGVLAANVNGGSKMLIDAFLVPEYLSANPSDVPIAENLKVELKRQADIVEELVAILKRRIPVEMPEMKPLLETLVDTFPQMAAELRSL